MSIIKKVIGRQVWDSRGWPTVEVDVEIEGGRSGRGIAPAGASRGLHEAVELRDGGEALGGKGVEAALEALADHVEAHLDVGGLFALAR